MITIEESHKFLSPGVAPQTIFGTIAREMRKYNVTLMVIDQRPGAIDSEVMSQLGTKLVCMLDNERDIEAVLGGAPGGRELRTVLSSLDSKQQALLFGHALPMPVVVRTREYGSAQSYAGLTVKPGRGKRGETAEATERPIEDELQDLFSLTSYPGGRLTFGGRVLQGWLLQPPAISWVVSRRRARRLRRST